MTDIQRIRLQKIVNATFNRYISEKESYIALENLIENINKNDITDIEWEEI